MLSGIKALGTFLLGQLTNPATAGQADEPLQVAVIEILAALKFVAGGFDQLFTRLKTAWSKSVPLANNIGTVLHDVGNYYRSDLSRIVTVIIPNTAQWVLGAVHKWADAKFLPRTFLKSGQWLTVVKESRLGYTFWQANHYWLHHLRVKAFPALIRWQIRRAEPQIRQLWALNPHAYPLEPVILDKAATYLQSTRGQTDLRNLTALIVDESPQVWQHVEAAILAFLNTPYG